MLFSLCRFKQLTGNYPDKISVVSLKFKKQRFVDYHRAAVKFPASRFFYYSNNGETSSEKLESSEFENALKHFQNDPYGCGDFLRGKKATRNVMRKHVPYPQGCAEMSGLFTACGNHIYEGRLPWEMMS